MRGTTARCAYGEDVVHVSVRTMRRMDLIANDYYSVVPGACCN